MKYTVFTLALVMKNSILLLQIESNKKILDLDFC